VVDQVIADVVANPFDGENEQDTRGDQRPNVLDLQWQDVLQMDLPVEDGDFKNSKIGFRAGWVKNPIEQRFDKKRHGSLANADDGHEENTEQ